MNSLFAEYTLERVGAEIIESERGFLTFSTRDETCFIHDFFVRREHRGAGYGKALFREVVEIAKSRKCRVVVGEVVIGARNAAESLSIILSRGFLPLKAENGIITLAMEI